MNGKRDVTSRLGPVWPPTPEQLAKAARTLTDQAIRAGAVREDLIDVLAMIGWSAESHAEAAK